MRRNIYSIIIYLQLILIFFIGAPLQYLQANTLEPATDNLQQTTNDANGNMIRRTTQGSQLSAEPPVGTMLYTYDAENQLTRIDFPDSTWVTYRYDGLGRRFEKNVNGTITRWVHDNEDIILEYNGSNTLIARYTHGIGIDEPLVMARGGNSYFYHSDGLGSITGLTDITGLTVQSYIYNSFGKIVKQTGSIINPYTYTAREFDAESGLYYYRARYYDANIGRFLQEDPIGFMGGINFYTYTFNSPINHIDPTGTIVDTALDAISLGASVYEFATCPSWGSAFNILLDAGGLLIPGAPSPGTVRRGKKALGLIDDAGRKTVRNITYHAPVSPETALAGAEKWLGAGYREAGQKGSGVFLSADGTKIFRMGPKDLAGTHGEIGKHVHFISRNPLNGQPLENLHLPIIE